MLEEMIFDNGQMVNANLADYMIPSLLDVPVDFDVELMESEDSEAEAHGIGETTLPPIPPAIGNAIYNAVGVRFKYLPIVPEQILRGLKKGTVSKS